MSDPNIDQFKNALPAPVRKSVTPEMQQRILDLLNDPDLHETYRENLLSYTKVMEEGKFKLSSYIDAVKYVSHRLMGKTMKDAYEATFPDKVQDWVMRGVALKDQSSYITAYNKTKLVNLIMEQTLVPVHVLNMDLYQRALNTQADLMVNAKSEMVRTTAANSILNQLKPPESQKVELEVSQKESSAISDLRKATQELVAQQRMQIQSGQKDAQEVAHSKITYDNDTGEQV